MRGVNPSAHAHSSAHGRPKVQARVEGGPRHEALLPKPLSCQPMTPTPEAAGIFVWAFAVSPKAGGQAVLELLQPEGECRGGWLKLHRP